MAGIKTKQLVYSLILIPFLFGSGCTVKLQNLTPLEFPWQYFIDKPPPDKLFYPDATGQQLADLAKNPKHRFMLEVLPVRVSSIRAYITVNGSEHLMQGNHGGLWTYESTNECTPVYKYYYRVSYRAGLFESKNKYLDSGLPRHPAFGRSFTCIVRNSGHAIWYNPGFSPNTGNGEVSFHPGLLKSTIVVQNLRVSPIVLYSIGLANFEGTTDNEQFAVLDVPTLPLQLNCGDSISFSVGWDPIGPYPSATGALQILANNSSGGLTWSVSIILKGHQGPP